jgi:hypothetical protein
MEHPKSQDARHASKVNTSPRRPRSACSVRLCKIQRLRSQLAEPEVVKNNVDYQLYILTYMYI